MWRIFEFELNEIYPHVINLQLHISHKQSVTIWENQNLQQVLQWDHVSKTTLPKFFNTSSVDDKARKFLYRKISDDLYINIKCNTIAEILTCGISR